VENSSLSVATVAKILADILVGENLVILRSNFYVFGQESAPFPTGMAFLAERQRRLTLASRKLRTACELLNPPRKRDEGGNCT